MNTNRFLTRVFDTQEKKMLYPLQNEFIDDEYNLLACNATHLITRPISGKDAITYIPFGDRFVPMMCTGLPDKNKKLIYAGDILRVPPRGDYTKINFVSYEVFFHDNDSCDCHIGFQMNRLHYHGNVVGGSAPYFKPKATSRMEIIGNRWEQPKLWEVKA